MLQSGNYFCKKLKDGSYSVNKKIGTCLHFCGFFASLDKVNRIFDTNFKA